MKRVFLLLFFLTQFAWSNGPDKPTWSNHSFWVVLQPHLKDISLMKTENGNRFGISTLDAIITESRLKSVSPEVPSATDDDRDGDVYMQNIYRMEIDPSEDMAQAIAKFSADKNVLFAERIPIYYPEEITPLNPNDTYINSQWHISKIQAQLAWGMWNGAIPGSDTVVVAIIDTGVDWDHPDLLANIYVNPLEDIDGDGVVGDYGASAAGGDEDGIDNDGNGYVDDLIGWDFCGVDPNSSPVPDNNPHSSVHQGLYDYLMHGTHVAGTASPVTNNGLGVAGPGFIAKIVPVKVAFDDDYLEVPGVYASASTYVYAAKTGAHVVNCSFGGAGYSGVVQSAVNVAHDTYGAIIVAAAGNDNVNLQNTPHYPSDYNNVISVAATNSVDTKAGFSNYGPSVDISAPGVGIWSTVYKNVGSGYSGPSWSGTSMAAPVVAGCFALLKAYFPQKDLAWLEQRLIDSTDPLDQLNPNYAGMLGSGRVNIYKAIAQGIFPSIQYTSQSLQIIGDPGGQLNPGESATMRVTLKNESGWNAASGISATLRCPGGDLIITDSLAVFPNINSGSIGFNLADLFEFSVAPQASIGQIPVELYVTANQASAAPYDITLNFDIEVGIDQAGWPAQLNTSIESSSAIIDIDQDGQNEIIAAGGDGNLYVWSADGAAKSGFPVALGGILGSVAVADINDNGKMEIAVGSRSGKMHIIENNGASLLEFSASSQIWGAPTLANLDGDAELEIVFGDFLGKLYAINPDGSDLANFPVDLQADHRVLSSAAVGDLNGDGVKDIVVGTFSGEVYAISASTGAVLPNFPVATGARIETDPVIADLCPTDTRGKEIVATNIVGKIFIIGGDGLGYRERSLGASLKSSPAIADLNFDGCAEIVLGADNGRLFALDTALADLSGFPVIGGGKIQSSPAIADLNMDGSPEIIFTSTDGYLNALQNDGSIFNGFPVLVGGLLKSHVTLADVDADGDLEIAAGGVNEMKMYDIPGGGETLNLWFTLQGNYRRTGDYSEVAVSITPATPAQLPLEYNLAANYPNPFNPATTIEFTLMQPQRVELFIFNALGQRVKTLISRQAAAGIHRLVWNGRDDANRAVSSGIYFYRLEAGEFSQTRKMMYLR